MVAPVIVGWQTLLKGSASPPDDSGGAAESFVDPNIITRVPVTAVESNERFRVKTLYGEAEFHVPRDAEVWAGVLGPYTPAVGDTVHATGHWEGVPGESLFVVRRISFNLERVRGLLTTDSTVMEQVAEFAVDSDKGRWNVRIEADKLTSATVPLSDSGPELTGMSAVGLAKAGWAIDMIGFREPDGTLLVTWVEFYPPPGRADGG
jgi:hypothetical protein